MIFEDDQIIDFEDDNIEIENITRSFEDDIGSTEDNGKVRDAKVNTGDNASLVSSTSSLETMISFITILFVGIFVVLGL